MFELSIKGNANFFFAFVLFALSREIRAFLQGNKGSPLWFLKKLFWHFKINKTSFKTSKSLPCFSFFFIDDIVASFFCRELPWTLILLRCNPKPPPVLLSAPTVPMPLNLDSAYRPPGTPLNKCTLLYKHANIRFIRLQYDKKNAVQATVPKVCRKSGKQLDF